MYDANTCTIHCYGVDSPFIPSIASTFTFLQFHYPQNSLKSPREERLTETFIPFPPIPRKRQTINKSIQSTPPFGIGHTILQRNHTPIHNHTNPFPIQTLACHFLKIGSRGKRYGESGRITGVVSFSVLLGGVGKWEGIVKAHGGVDGGDVIVVAKVGKKGMTSTDWEGGWVVV